MHIINMCVCADEQHRAALCRIACHWLQASHCIDYMLFFFETSELRNIVLAIVGAGILEYP